MDSAICKKKLKCWICQNLCRREWSLKSETFKLGWARLIDRSWGWTTCDWSAKTRLAPRHFLSTSHHSIIPRTTSPTTHTTRRPQHHPHSVHYRYLHYRSDLSTLTPTMAKLLSTRAVEAILGHTMRDSELLWLALQAAGSGVGGPDGNKRLAMIGDSILKSVLIEDLYFSNVSRGMFCGVLSLTPAAVTNAAKSISTTGSKSSCRIRV